MTQEIDQNYSVEAVALRTPGHLLAPFGWAANALATMAEVKPSTHFSSRVSHDSRSG
jgi:hypothetical protein